MTPIRPRAYWVTIVALCMSLSPPVQGESAQALPKRARVATYKSGLRFPVDMAWVKATNKIFFTEKNTGKVRVMIGRKLLARACVDLDVDGTGERGALGLALHPRFKATRKLYVYYTNESPLENRVTRFKVRHNRCRKPRHIVRGLGPPSDYHNGGQLEFAGGRLYVSTGEAHDPSKAQSLRSRLGKVLRLEPNGSVPRGNPFSRNGRRSAVWSYGHRNPFGLAHKPGTTRIYETENGPSCDDELNRIRKGRNYGWGTGYGCGSAGVGARPKSPLFRWDRVVVPTDPWWYQGRMRALSGDLYVGDFSTGRLHRFILNQRGGRVIGRKTVFDGAAGIVDVAKGPGGWLYFMTSSSIFRIVPG